MKQRDNLTGSRIFSLFLCLHLIVSSAGFRASATVSRWCTSRRCRPMRLVAMATDHLWRLYRGVTRGQRIVSRVALIVRGGGWDDLSLLVSHTEPAACHENPSDCSGGLQGRLTALCWGWLDLSHWPLLPKSHTCQNEACCRDFGTVAVYLLLTFWFFPSSAVADGVVLCFCFSGPLWSTRSFWGCSGTGRSVSWWFWLFSHLVWLLDPNLSWIQSSSPSHWSLSQCTTEPESGFTANNSILSKYFCLFKKKK